MTTSIVCPVDGKDDTVQKISSITTSGVSYGTFSGPSGGVTNSGGKWGTYAGYTSQSGSMTTGLAELLSPPIKPQQPSFLTRMANDLAGSGKLYPKQLARWEKKIAKWNRLYYCHKHDIVFDANTNETYSPSEIHSLLHSGDNTSGSYTWTLVAEDNEYLISSRFGMADPIQNGLTVTINGQLIVGKQSGRPADFTGEYPLPIPHHNAVLEVEVTVNALGWRQARCFLMVDNVEIPEGKRVVLGKQIFASTPPPIPDTSSPTSASVVDELAKLADLKERGLIDEAEYKALKEKLIQRP